jgi:hypothetical protein
MSDFILLQNRLYMEASGVIPIPSLSNIGFEETGVLKVLQSLLLRALYPLCLLL